MTHDDLIDFGKASQRDKERLSELEFLKAKYPDGIDLSFLTFEEAIAEMARIIKEKAVHENVLPSPHTEYQP